MYEREVAVDMLNVVKSLLADVSSVSPSSERRCFLFLLCSDEGLTLETSANALFTAFNISNCSLAAKPFDNVLIYNSKVARFISKLSELQSHYQAKAWLLFI